MKFLAKINRNYLVMFGITLVMLSFSGYFILRAILNQNTKNNLLSKAVLVEKQISATGQIPDLRPLVEVKAVKAQASVPAKFSEENIYNETENEQEAFIEYTATVQVNHTCYLLKLREASVESEDLAISIALSIFILMLAAFAMAYVITRKLNKTTWAAFEQNLKIIENFDFRQNATLALQPAGIDEFDRLNSIVRNLTGKLKQDFVSLKEFTENASHEIQTPLTIASMQLEEILQQDLPAGVFERVANTLHALRKLSALNQNLLLLAKIENKQFIESESVDFGELIKQKLEEFEPLFQTRNITVESVFEADLYIRMNPHLAEILVNNLLSNALNHNQAGGSILITIHDKELKICNTGVPNSLDTEAVFQRFVKGNSRSHGLGLAIVKQICQTYGLSIAYTKNQLHCFTLSCQV